jgi:hypothetical protein
MFCVVHVPNGVYAVSSHHPINRYVPIIAGSAVGRKADSRQTVKARGQFQTFDTKRGWVENQARCVSYRGNAF